MEQDLKSSIKVEKVSIVDQPITETAIRHKGIWYKIKQKPFEPERQTYSIAWKEIRMNPQQAYKEWYSKEREDAKLLYPSFRNE